MDIDRFTITKDNFTFFFEFFFITSFLINFWYLFTGVVFVS